MAMNLNDALETFIAESRGLLQDMESALLQLEQQPGDAEAVNAVFRAAHTIKGAAGLFGLDEIVEFTHQLETLLVRVRDGSLALSGVMIGLLLRGGDHIGALLDGLETQRPLEAEARHAAAELLAQLQAEAGLAPGSGLINTQAPAGAGAAPRPVEADPWHISLRLCNDLLREGFDPASFIHHLRTVGRIVRVDTITSGLPALREMDPETCYLGFEIRVVSAAERGEIESVFDFIRDQCQVRILAPDSRVEDYLRLIEDLPADRLRLGEILVAAGALTERELAQALQAQQSAGEAPPPLGQILTEQQALQPELVQAAIGRQTELRQRQASESRLIRVHADKLDALITMVGELIIAGSSVGLLALNNKDRSLREAVSMMSRLTEGVRDSAMRLRMVEIGETFNRFHRVVRDVSKELGKDIELHVSGADTELDKSLVDRLGDPLTHLVRNAIDHGIEAPALREQRGKPAAGRLDLKAYHEAGFVVIEVADDGGGLSRERILAKARQRGLIAVDAQPGDAQVWNLVFEPGFSTADQVSNISGRGVGMDVVRKSIEALRGAIEIDSVEGRGATFRIRLPLTMAIIDGFLMAVGEAHYVVPLEAVLECVKLEPEQRERDVINLRGEVLPLLRLRRHFGLGGRTGRRENVVVVQVGGRRAGLVVDQLKGELQAVIKPLGPLMEGLPGISGSTILGSGEVALTLDIVELLNQAARAQGSLAAPARAALAEPVS